MVIAKRIIYLRWVVTRKIMRTTIFVTSIEYHHLFRFVMGVPARVLWALQTLLTSLVTTIQLLIPMTMTMTMWRMRIHARDFLNRCSAFRYTKISHFIARPLPAYIICNFFFIFECRWFEAYPYYFYFILFFFQTLIAISVYQVIEKKYLIYLEYGYKSFLSFLLADWWDGRDRMIRVIRTLKLFEYIDLWWPGE